MASYGADGGGARPKNVDPIGGIGDEEQPTQRHYGEHCHLVKFKL